MQIEESSTSELTNNKIFELLDARFSRKYILYEHLHNSYNDLINNVINYYYTNDNIFEENKVGDLVYRYKFVYSDLYVRPPYNENDDMLLYPTDARNRSTTYSIKIIGKITQYQEIYDLNLKKINSVVMVGQPSEKEIILGIPCMVRSKYCSLTINRDYSKKECEYDPGGYFIVNGSEKFVLSQEEMAPNKVFIFVKKDINFNTYKAKINSRPSDPNLMTQGMEIAIEKSNEIKLKVPILAEVSVFVVMRALGLETDRDIIKYIVYNEQDIDMMNLLKMSIDLSKKEGKKLILNKEDAYYVLTNKIRVVKKYADRDRKLQYDEKKEHLDALLRNSFLPHINADHYNDVLKAKAYFIGYMVNKLLNCYLGRIKPDDRDSFTSKRINMPGDLIFELVKQQHKRMLNECSKFFKKRSGSNHDSPLNIINQIKSGNIEQGIKSAMMTGTWSKKKKGVAQMYPRLTYLQSLSFLRRVDAPSSDSSTMKLTGPRHYHPSQVGFLCLTADTEILMSDYSIKLIKDVKNGDLVISVDQHTMKQVITPVKNWFKKNTTQLLKIITHSNKIIKCTPEHKFLVKHNDVFEMLEISKMSIGDNLIICHSPKYIEINKTTELLVNENNIDEEFRIVLKHLGLLNQNITQEKMEILGRILGFYFTKNFTTMSYIRDMQFLGFENKEHHNAIFYCFIKQLTNENFNIIPEWIMNANNRIQREFISGFVSNISCNITYENSNVKFEIEPIFTKNQMIGEQLQQLFENFDIEIKINNLNDGIIFESNIDNFIKYGNLINNVHCEELRIKYGLMLEYAGYYNYTKNIMGFDEVICWEKFLKQNQIDGISDYFFSKIASIENVELEPVYDFETVLNTHSFIASSIISSNCCVESPEHVNIGLVKHLSLLSTICVGSQEQADIMYNILTSHSKFVHMNNVSPTLLVNYAKIFLNGEWIGMTLEPMEIYTEMKKLKLSGTILRTNGICYDIPKSELRFYTDAGRLVRPLLTVKNNKIILTDVMIDSILKDKTIKGISKWDALIDKYPEAIEFIDMEEQYYMLVSEYKDNVVDMKRRETITIPDSNLPIVNRYDDTMILKYTHCEFHPTMVIGIIAGNIPFANHNQGPRNIFQYAQGRQAMSFYNSNYRDRLDISYILYNAQKPLVNTKIAKYIHMDILPCGEQAIMAIGCYTGHNQDDSVVFNKSSIERGLFRSTSLKKWSSKIEKNQSTSQDDIFTKPDMTKLAGSRHADYNKLNDKGYVPEETLVENLDVIIGKVTPIQPTPGSNKIFSDKSEIYKSLEPAIIDKVFTGLYDAEGYEMIKIRTRSERIPKIGDKFCIKIDESNPFEILTENGWMTLNNLNLGIRVATLNNDSNLCYEYPTGIYKFKYSGSMMKINSPYAQIEVTMDHSMYVKQHNSNDNFILIEAKKLIGTTFQLKTNCTDYIYDELIDDIDSTFPKWNYLCDLIGLFVQNGSLDSNQMSIFIECNDVEKIKQICSNVNLTFTNVNSIYKINSLSGKLVDFFKEFCQSDVIPCFECSNLPSWIKKLSMKRSRQILNSFNSKIITKYEELASDIQILAIHSGCSSSITFDSTESKYCVDIHFDNSNNCHEPIVNIEEQSITEYTGYVGCIEVSNHVFMIRNNKRHIWIGNCTRHGQKGTIGLTLSQSDMPFTKDGIYPDFIISTLAIPGRMTIAQLLECLLGKIGAIRGIEVDGTSFNEIDIEKIKDMLEQLGYERNATEYLTNGMTGQRLKMPIFIGPTYYQRLKHLVMDKIHSRSRGPITMLTRQALEGRSKDGGLRCGEMERDCIISHGLAKFLKERMLNVSDAYSCYVCDICGLFAQRMIKKEHTLNPLPSDTYHCVACKNKTKISKVVIPYAFKLLVQELLSMNIAPRIRTSQYDDLNKH